MTREWKPGTVAAISTSNKDYALAFWDSYNEQWVSARSGRLSMAATITAIRPLVVIDPEDREQVGKLIAAVKREAYAMQSTDAMQDALRSLIAPPKPEVFEHYPRRGANVVDGVVHALCGKVWRPVEATVKGRCPECTEIVEKGWVS